MALYEERCGVGSQEVLDLSSSQGRASASVWPVAALRDSLVEVGTDFHWILSPSYRGLRVDIRWVIVDQLTKSAHFLAIIESSSAEKLAEIYVQEVVACHGVPTLIVSNRDM